MEAKQGILSHIKYGRVICIRASDRPVNITHIVLPRSVLSIQQLARPKITRADQRCHILCPYPQKRRMNNKTDRPPCPLDFYRECPCNVNTPQSVVPITCHRKPTANLSKPLFAMCSKLGPENAKSLNPNQSRYSSQKKTEDK